MVMLSRRRPGLDDRRSQGLRGGRPNVGSDWSRSCSIGGRSSLRLMARALARAESAGTPRSLIRYAPQRWLARHATVQCKSSLPFVLRMASANFVTAAGEYGYSAFPRIGMYT